MKLTTSTEARADRRNSQVATATKATRYGLPWTADEDAHLLHGAGPVVLRAARLGRTYYAAQLRLVVLRRRAREDAS